MKDSERAEVVTTPLVSCAPDLLEIMQKVVLSSIVTLSANTLRAILPSGNWVYEYCKLFLRGAHWIRVSPVSAYSRKHSINSHVANVVIIYTTLSELL